MKKFILRWIRTKYVMYFGPYNHLFLRLGKNEFRSSYVIGKRALALVILNPILEIPNIG